MPTLALAHAVVVLLALIGVALYLTMQDASGGRARRGVEALRVALVLQLLALVTAFFDSSDLHGLLRTSILYHGVGLGAWGGARLAERFSGRRGLSFARSEAVGFAGVLVGTAAGRFAAHVVNNVVNVYGFDGSWQWMWAGDTISDLFLEIELMALAVLAMVVASIRLIYHVRLYGERQRREAQETALVRLRAQTARAQLQSLQARVNPHFLYNALNALAGLIHDRPDEAEAMTLRLARLFRAALDAGAAPITTVRHETALVETYLAVEAARFGPRLESVVDVAPDALDAPVPRFLLQPLVENAVRHGIGRRPEGGTVRLDIRRRDADLVVEVRDDGPPFPDDLTPGYGLASVRESLALLYPGRHDFTIDNGPDKGVRIVLRADAHGRLLADAPVAPALAAV